MASRKRWVWIIVGVMGVGLIVLIAAAAAGVYFVTHHIRSERATDMDAIRAFDTVRASFKDQRPLYEIDSADQPRLTRSLAEAPAAPVRAGQLSLLAWDPEQHRLVTVSLPLWVLRMGKQKLEVVGDDRGFDLDRLKLDVDELARIGRTLVLDFRNRDGVRVLLWTE